MLLKHHIYWDKYACSGHKYIETIDPPKVARKNIMLVRNRETNLNVMDKDNLFNFCL